MNISKEFLRLKNLIKTEKMAAYEISEMLGFGPGFLSMKFTREQLQFSRVVEILNILGYEIQYVKKG